MDRSSALIFDCDGTLVDNAALHCRAWTAALASVGGNLRESWYYARVGIPGSELLRQFRDEHDLSFDTTAVVTEHARHYMGDVHTVRVVDRIARIARGARDSQQPIAVASGGQRAIVEATLTAAQLRHLFQVIVTVEDVAGKGKPAPDLFLEAARRLGVAPRHCTVYEDSDEGIEAARRAGMRAIDVRQLS